MNETADHVPNSKSYGTSAHPLNELTNIQVGMEMGTDVSHDDLVEAIRKWITIVFDGPLREAGARELVNDLPARNSQEIDFKVLAETLLDKLSISRREDLR